MIPEEKGCRAVLPFRRAEMFVRTIETEIEIEIGGEAELGVTAGHAATGTVMTTTRGAKG